MLAEKDAKTVFYSHFYYARNECRRTCAGVRVCVWLNLK